MTTDPDDGSESESLPEVLQSEWPRHQVLTYFGDLTAGAEVDHVQVRSRGPDGIEDRKTTLR